LTKPAANPLAILLLLVGVLCCSTSAIIIRESHLHPAELAAYRLLGSALILSPIYFLQLRKHRQQYHFRHLRITLLPALTLALHIISWNQGAQSTRLANATLIVNMVPIAVPFLLFLIARERIARREVWGTIIALSGAALLASSDFGIDRRSLLGDITCFVSMILFSYYLVQGRLNRDVPSLWLYLVPLYAVAGVICFVIALFVAHPLGPHPARGYLMALAAVILPATIGHSILNYSMQRLSGQVVSVCNLFQFLFAGILGFLLFHDIPRPAVYIAGALVVAGAVIVIRSAATTPQGRRDLELEVAEPQAA